MGKKILILSEAFGAGHTKAGEALKEGILLFHPEWKADVIELGVWLRPKLSQWISAVYMKTLRYSPKLWGTVYRKIQRQTVKPQAEYLLHRFFYSEVIHLLKEYNPDLIICTHPFPGAVISRLKRMGLNIPLFTVITDYGAHGSWVNSGIDHYFVPSEQVWNQLIKWGIPHHRVHVTGIPTHPKFWKRIDKAKIRKKLGLNEMPTLLCMGGGLGMGLSMSMLETICKYRENMQILWVTGQNGPMYRMIKGDKRFHHTHFHVYPFIDNIDELMDASDLLLTKPGGITCTEAMVKEIPMMLINPIPGQEEDNFRYVTEMGAGIPIYETREVELVLESFVKTSKTLFEEVLFKVSPAFGQTSIEIITNELDR